MNIPSPLFIVSGPSGAGEDSVIEGLSQVMPIERVITTTTRAPRTGESEGSPYYFLQKEIFESKITHGELLEYAQQYNGNFYGVTHSEIDRVRQSGKIGIWKVEYQGVMSVKKLFPGIIAILITAPLEVIEERIRHRDISASEAYIKERMDYTREWLQHADIYDYTVVNEQGKLHETIEKVRQIITEHAQQD